MEEAWELAALDMGKGTEISIGKEGFSFKTDGEASERLANAALDFLSPITEGAGFLGTKLRGYRMEAALTATLRAKKIIEQNDLEIKPVPPKFLLQWVEGASLEDLADKENLSDLWANLLVSKSVSDFDNLEIFIDVVKKLNSSHRRTLERFIEQGLPEHGMVSPSAHRMVAEAHVELCRMNAINYSLIGSDIQELVFRSCMHGRGGLVCSYVVQKDQSLEQSNIEFDENYFENLNKLSESDEVYNTVTDVPKSSFIGLDSLGLIEELHVTGLGLGNNMRMNIFSWKLTTFGLDFLKAAIVSRTEK